MTLEGLQLFTGLGLCWGIVITSTPYLWLLDKLSWDETVLECALCTGTWFALGLSLLTGFDAIQIAALPLSAEWISRWIRK